MSEQRDEYPIIPMMVDPNLGQPDPPDPWLATIPGMCTVLLAVGLLAIILTVIFGPAGGTCS